jgi:glycosyltransferase involved in cell wall biosynthesis
MNPEPKNQAPALSVVIPVYNGALVLEQCLSALRRSTFTAYECVVVDDGSNDESGEVALRHGARLLRLQHKRGPAHARNRGAEVATASVILFLDADVCVHANTVEKVVRYFESHPEVDALFGSYDDRPTDQGFVSRYKNLFHHYIHQSAKHQASTFWAGCGAVRRNVFLGLGGFDETYRRPSIEDIELGFRLRSRGKTIHLVKDIQATHLKRWTFRNLLRTDVFDRAIPWTLLMLRDKTVPVDLNLRFSHQLSVVILYGILLIAASAPVWGTTFTWAGLSTMTSVVGMACGILVLLNGNLYLFFAQKQSWQFAIRALPIHWLYYLYSGAAVAVAITLHLWNERISPYR